MPAERETQESPDTMVFIDRDQEAPSIMVLLPDRGLVPYENIVFFEDGTHALLGGPNSDEQRVRLDAYLESLDSGDDE